MDENPLQPTETDEALMKTGISPRSPAFVHPPITLFRCEGALLGSRTWVTDMSPPKKRVVGLDICPVASLPIVGNVDPGSISPS